ncbi:MAG: RecB family exonuclease [Actinomycetota bacterium]
MDELILELPQAAPPEPSRRLSYSSLSTYERCGLQYKFQYLDRLPGKPSPILSFGNSLHEALRRWYNQPVPVAPPLEELLAHLDDAWDSTPFRHTAEERTFRNHARQVLTDYHGRHAGEFRIPVALEQRFEIDLGGVRVTGVLDRMDRHPDGAYEIIDYKTNRRLPPLERVQKDLQLSIYYMAAWEVWGIRPERLTLYFLLPGQPMTTTRTIEDAAATKERILRVAEQIAAGGFEPNESALCGWCDYRALCPLFAHEALRVEEPRPDIDAVVAEWIQRKRRNLEDWRRLEELGAIIHEHCEREGLQRLFGEDGAITRYARSDPAFDPAIVRDALPPELLERVLRVDDASVGALLAGELPDDMRARLEEAQIDRTTWNLRLREERRKRR